MDPAKQLKAAGPVVDRVLSDKRVQDQLVEAGDHLQQVYRLVSRRKAKAAEDKRVYDHVRRGVVALRKAGETATEPRRPPIGKVLVLALVAGAGAAALANRNVRDRLVGGASAPEASAPLPT
jgi:hypothetical protein